MKKILWIVFLSSLLALKIYCLNNSVDFGEEITQFENQKTNLLLENNDLENKIAVKTSCSEIYQKAVLRGFLQVSDEILANDLFALNR